MSGIFPIRQQVELDDQRGPRLVDLDESVADSVFDALSAATTRAIFGTLHEEPQTASDLAAQTDTSVQNAQYHLDKLVDADLVEVVDTWYSERGTEMNVYAPTDESLVLFAGRDEDGTLRSLLERVVVMLPVLGLVSVLVGWLAGHAQDGGDAAFNAPGGADGVSADAVETASRTAETAAVSDPALVAGVGFFLGGVFVIALVVATWYWRH